MKAALVADLFTLVGMTPLDKRKQGAEAASFKNPHIGMYYGGKMGGGGSGGGSGQTKAGGRQNTSEQPNRKTGIKGKQSNAMRSTSTQREDAFQSTVATMQATFISGKK